MISGDGLLSTLVSLTNRCRATVLDVLPKRLSEDLKCFYFFTLSKSKLFLRGLEHRSWAGRQMCVGWWNFVMFPGTVAQTTMMHANVQQICVLFGGNHIKECLFSLLSVSLGWNEIWSDILWNLKGRIRDFLIKEESWVFLDESSIECCLYPSAKLKLGLDGARISW